MGKKLNKSKSNKINSSNNLKTKNSLNKNGFKRKQFENQSGKKNGSFKKTLRDEHNASRNSAYGNNITKKNGEPAKEQGFKNKVPASKNEHVATRNYLLFKPGRWDTDEFPNDPTVFEPVSKEKEKELENVAKKVMAEEVEAYKLKITSQKGGSYNWLKTVSSKGTSGDKMAAFIYFVQESPLHNISYINSLITLLNKEKRSLESLGTMKDLFIQNLLPNNRKLRSFNQHPLGLLDELSSGNKTSKHKRLLLWYFESLLKQAYTDFLNALEVFSRDTIEVLRKKSIGIIWELLAEHPEQEKLLLQMLVNKLGDRSSKVASYVIHLIRKLLIRHKRMNLVVALETERLLYRTNVSRRAQFYGACLLGELKLQESDSDLACRILDIFFGFFKLYISKGDIETKMLSAILSGVNKVFPYAKANREKVLEQTEALYKICHMTKFNTSVQALSLLHRVIDTSDKSSDRFYVLLYKKLLDPELSSSTKLPLFLNLLCQSMKKDAIAKRVQAFAKRLLQLCHSLSPHLVCSALLVLSEVSKEKENLFKFEKDAEEEESDDEHFEDEKDDEDNNKPVQRETDDEEEEVADKDPPKSVGKESWVHRQNNNYRLGHYDPMHRNPMYCRADLECTWELLDLVNHGHPTISLFAKTLLKGEAVKYSGDPLSDFTFKRFLERFVARNPKKDTDSDLKSKNKRGEEEEDGDEDIDAEVPDAMDVDKDIDFGTGFGDIFKDDDDDDYDSENDEDGDDAASEIDEITEDEDGGIAALGIPSEKAMKQSKWEDAREKSKGRKRKRPNFSSKRGPKAKKNKK